MMGLSLPNELEDGAGTPLILLHGWLGSRESWQQVRDHLDVDNPLLVYDQRCHGDAPCQGFDFGDLADDLHALVQGHGLDDPVLVGHSMGGMVALTYAARHGAPAGLLLLGTSAATPDPELESPAFYLDRFGEMDRRAWAERITDNYIDGRGPLWEETVEQLVAADDEAVVSGLRAMVDYDVRGELDAVDVPARVVGGHRDRAIPPHQVEELADLLDCPFDMIESAHLMLQEVPGMVADTIDAFAGETANQS
ncbi:MAG: alpha/beta hydrolase [Candidatus Nanohaloarchaea archaeon]|nr:alpha/beta hydrolase [Candidatus Nanohaloarchaea archaeon]